MIRPLMRLFLSLSLFAVLSVACQSAPAAPTQDISMALTQAYETAVAQLATPTPTETPVPSPTAVRTPPALPGVFQTALLDPVNTPHTYIQDSCQALKAKWDPNNAAP